MRSGEDCCGCVATFILLILFSTVLHFAIKAEQAKDREKDRVEERRHQDVMKAIRESK